MFHWICPECGREIAPTAKECAACDPSATPLDVAPETALIPELVAAEPEPPAAPMVLTPEIVGQPAPKLATPVIEPEPLLLAAPVAPVALLAPVTEPQAAPEPEFVAPEPAPLQPRMPNIPQPKAAVFKTPQPIGSPAPVLTASEPQLPASPPEIQAAEPSIASEVPHAPLREPQARAFAQAPVAIAPVAIEPIAPAQTATQLPRLTSPISTEPSLAAPIRTAPSAIHAIQPAPGQLSIAASDPHEQISLPGPTLPYELTSLDAAGIARMLPWGAQIEAQRNSGTMVSVAVASGFLALAIAGVFYAMPTMAGSKAEPKPAPKAVEAAAVPEPAAPAHKAPAELEVTGVRFVTDLPDRPPQIHYIVVNHTNGSLSGVVVNVTLRASANQPPLSQFSFRSPRLAPYESKEMISSIERLNRPLDTPDWRDVQTEITYEH